MSSATDDPAHPSGLSISLPCEPVALEQAQQAMAGYLDRCGVASRVRNRVEVVIEELVGNLVRHDSHASHIEVRGTNGSKGFELTIEDDGAPFDPFAVAAPAPFADLGSATVGGLGIPLVRKLSASVDYARTSAARNRVTVRFAPQ